MTEVQSVEEMKIKIELLKKTQTEMALKMGKLNNPNNIFSQRPLLTEGITWGNRK